ncbi:hypothetical protein PR003_g9718 [Phytophthora rubi]|uniref:Uncharacterized protein n=1 Tax=Phytophthora rubi TaxID=129364 RepID=A0A6A4F7V8_9STRA|nr:hypothetical protein PR003_g9718 [Phytophthora rubi]
MAAVMEEPDDKMNADGRMRAIMRFLHFLSTTIDRCKFLVGATA